MDQQTDTKSDAIVGQQSSQYAPFYDLPQLSIVCVEHPFIIKNVDNAFKMLGGLPKIQSVQVLPVSIH